MASVKNLKKDLKFVFGDILDSVFINEILNGANDKSSALINEIIEAYDIMIADLNDKKVEDKKNHIKKVRANLITKANEFAEKVNSL